MFYYFISYCFYLAIYKSRALCPIREKFFRPGNNIYLKSV